MALAQLTSSTRRSDPSRASAARPEGPEYLLDLEPPTPSTPVQGQLHCGQFPELQSALHRLAFRSAYFQMPASAFI